MSERASWRHSLPRMSRHRVIRPRVRNLLDRRQPLTVLAAPHGYGKSVAMVSWLDRAVEEDLVCYVDVTPGDQPAQVWQRILRGLTGGSVPAERAYDELTTWLADGDAPVVLVIDSLHNLDEAGFVDDLVRLLRRSPRLFAVLATRQLRGDFVDIAQAVDTVVIDQRDLSFRADDSFELFGSYELGDHRDQCDRLHEAVDGWPTLVHRGVLSIAEGRAADPSAPMPDLVDVALARARDHVAGTMLPELVPPELLPLAQRCASVGTIDSATVPLLADDAEDEAAAAQGIADLARAGVLIARRELDRMSWSMPSALAVALRGQAAVPDQSVEAMQRRFLERHLAEEDWPRALVVGLLLDDAAALTNIVARGWPFLTVNHDAVLQQAFARIPDEVLATSPAAVAAKGLLLNARTREQPDTLPDDPVKLAELVERDDVVALLFEQLTIMLADRSSGRLQEATNSSRKLVHAVELADRVRPGAVDEIAGAIHAQAGVTAEVAGDLRRAAEHFDQALTFSDEDPSGTASRSAQGGLAMIEALQGRMAHARRRVEQVAALPPYQGWLGRRLLTPRLIAEAWLALERLDRTELDPLVGMLEAQMDDDLLWGHIVTVRSIHDLVFADSWTAIDELRALRRRRGRTIPAGSYADLALTFAQSDHHLVLGQGTRARSMLATVPAGHPGAGIRRAVIALVSGDPEAALTETFAGQRLSIRRRAHLGMVRACAHVALGDLDTARGKAEKAMQRMMTYGLRTPLRFVPTEAVAQLLERVDLCDDHRALLREAIDVHPSPLPSRIEVISLTEREQAVLNGLALGLSAQQMATADYVSVNTIKAQARTLYRKLDVASRAQALARAREVGLIAEADDSDG